MTEPNAIVCVVTYPPDLQNGRIKAIRETWQDEWRELIDQAFFFDNTHRDPAEDEIILDAPTGLMNTSFKTWRLTQWLLENNYDYAFVIPTDCYVCVPRLLVSGFQAVDYTGYQAAEGHAGGGSGYWLSRKAITAVAGFEPYADYEDRWVGAAARASGIANEHDPRYWSWEQPWVRGIITAHLSIDTGKYDPRLMYAYHQTYLERGEIWPIPPLQTC